MVIVGDFGLGFPKGVFKHERRYMYHYCTNN